MWKNLNFSVKVIVLVCVLVLFTVLTGAGYQKMSNQIRDIGIQSASDEMLSGHKSELKNIVDVMASVLATATAEMTDKDEVYKAYKAFIKDARFFPDNSGYFFINEGTVVFAHAQAADIEGKDMANVTDATGFYHVKALDKAAKAGGGFVEYVWDKPGVGNQPKVSYVKMIPNSPYAIGTGVYIDDIEEKEAAILNGMNDHSKNFLVKWSVILLLAFLVIVLPLIIFMIKSMTSPLKELTNVASEYSRGDWDTEIKHADRKDEIGELSRAIKRLGSSTRIVMKKLESAK